MDRIDVFLILPLLLRKLCHWIYYPFKILITFLVIILLTPGALALRGPTTLPVLKLQLGKFGVVPPHNLHASHLELCLVA